MLHRGFPVVNWFVSRACLVSSSLSQESSAHLKRVITTQICHDSRRLASLPTSSVLVAATLAQSQSFSVFPLAVGFLSESGCLVFLWGLTETGVEVLMIDLTHNGCIVVPGMFRGSFVTSRKRKQQHLCNLISEFSTVWCCVPGHVVKPQEMFTLSDRSGYFSSRQERIIYIFSQHCFT